MKERREQSENEINAKRKEIDRLTEELRYTNENHTALEQQLEEYKAKLDNAIESKKRYGIRKKNEQKTLLLQSKAYATAKKKLEADKPLNAYENMCMNMIDLFEIYSFDDEVVNKFYYNAQEKEIIIYFPCCYKMKERINKESILIIKKWDDAKSKLCVQNCYKNLETYLGIISMILHLELKGKNVQLTVNTVDDRYVDLVFCNPQIDVKIM